jgi:hypothetical protein
MYGRGGTSGRGEMWRGEVSNGDVELEDEVQPREVFGGALTKFPVPTFQSMSRQLPLNPS